MEVEYPAVKSPSSLFANPVRRCREDELEFTRAQTIRAYPKLSYWTLQNTEYGRTRLVPSVVIEALAALGGNVADLPIRYAEWVKSRQTTVRPVE